MDISSPISDDATTKQKQQGVEAVQDEAMSNGFVTTYISIRASYMGSDGGYLMENGTSSLVGGGGRKYFDLVGCPGIKRTVSLKRSQSTGE